VSSAACSTFENVLPLVFTPLENGGKGGGVMGGSEGVVVSRGLGGQAFQGGVGGGDGCCGGGGGGRGWWEGEGLGELLVGGGGGGWRLRGVRVVECGLQLDKRGGGVGS